MIKIVCNLVDWLRNILRLIRHLSDTHVHDVLLYVYLRAHNEPHTHTHHLQLYPSLNLVTDKQTNTHTPHTTYQSVQIRTHIFVSLLFRIHVQFWYVDENSCRSKISDQHFLLFYKLWAWDNQKQVVWQIYSTLWTKPTHGRMFKIWVHDLIDVIKMYDENKVLIIISSKPGKTTRSKYVHIDE